jgi:hypothetical protein
MRNLKKKILLVLMSRYILQMRRFWILDSRVNTDFLYYSDYVRLRLGQTCVVLSLPAGQFSSRMVSCGVEVLKVTGIRLLIPPWLHEQ